MKNIFHKKYFIGTKLFEFIFLYWISKQKKKKKVFVNITVGGEDEDYILGME